VAVAVVVVVEVVIFNEDTNITVEWFTEGFPKNYLDKINNKLRNIKRT